MHAGKRYSTAELLIWTRKNILKFVILSVIPVLLYEYVNLRELFGELSQNKGFR